MVNRFYLVATAGHAVIVARLLDHGAMIEAQSERTKDTALSLACSGGRQEVVEVLLKKGANREHRNVSDYTGKSTINWKRIRNGFFNSVEPCGFGWICEYNSIIVKLRSGD